MADSEEFIPGLHGPNWSRVRCWLNEALWWLAGWLHTLVDEARSFLLGQLHEIGLHLLTSHSAETMNVEELFDSCVPVHGIIVAPYDPSVELFSILTTHKRCSEVIACGD